MYLIPPPSRRHASPALRDRFLTALEQRDDAMVVETTRDLLGCVNFLPSTTCIELGLPPGSSYGDAAESLTKQRITPAVLP